MQPLTTVPASGEKVMGYTITKIETDSAEFAAKYPKLTSIGVLATSLGKAVAIPYLIFDLPEPTGRLKFHSNTLNQKIVKMPEMSEPEGPVLHFRNGGTQGELTYQTVLGGEKVTIKLSFTPKEIVLGPPTASGGYWNVALGTRYGPSFVVQLDEGTPKPRALFSTRCVTMD